jgi:hypothetical protein
MRRWTTAILLAMASGASAHFVWIGSATKDGKLVVTSGFGEPGSVDKQFADRIKQAKYWVEGDAGKSSPLTMTLDQTAGEYRGEVSGKRPSVVLATCDYGVFQREGVPASHLVYSAKRIVDAKVGWKDGNPRKELPIELLVEFTESKAILTAIHNGKPLPNAEIKTFGPSDDHGVLKTDSEGVAEWPLKASGEYSCYVGATSEKTGEVKGKKFVAERDYTTLTFAKPNSNAVAGAFPPLPEAFSSFGAAASDGFVYVYGGHKADTHEYSTESVHGKFRRLNLKSPDRGWEELAEGPHAQGVALVAHRGVVYRLGGMQPRNAPGEPTDNVSLASCSAFDPKSNKWSEIPAFPEPRSSFDAVVVCDRIYVFGGWNMGGKGKPQTWFDAGLVLDLNDQKAGWKTLPQPFKRRALNIAEAGGKIYVVAGLTPNGETDSSVDVFDPANSQWSKSAPLPGNKRNAFSPAAYGMNGSVFASPTDGILYRLDEPSKAWKPVGKFEHKRIVHRMVPVGDGRLLVLGGASPEGNVAALEAVEPKS